jgi:hypothetical protein
MFFKSIASDTRDRNLLPSKASLSPQTVNHERTSGPGNGPRKWSTSKMSVREVAEELACQNQLLAVSLTVESQPIQSGVPDFVGDYDHMSRIGAGCDEY